MTKTALITGITGQDGSYLADLLLDQDYDNVVGLYRRSSNPNFSRIEHIENPRLTLVEFDLLDSSSCNTILKEYQPDELYNLAAQSHVGTSFKQPELTNMINHTGVLNLLEAVRHHSKHTKFYQASTSEMFGFNYTQDAHGKKYQDENTEFKPQSPYGVAKLAAHHLVRIYRDSYGIFGCCGILFNHESPRRGETFVTRKITRGLANIAQGLDTCLYMGNIDALRDWGHAKDYVRMQWMMLQQNQPEDFVIATGVQFSVRQFIQWSAQELGIGLRFEGKGVEEKATVTSIQGDMAPGLKVGDVVVQIDPRYFRPTEVETLLGDPSKAKQKLGWTPDITVQEMCAEMVREDLEQATKAALLKKHGYKISISAE